MHTDAWDALVNLKKFIREKTGEAGFRAVCIHLVDEFMQKAVVPYEEDDYVAWVRYHGSSISTCDSDADGAFKVYRHRSGSR